eukprot:TRINITY_DN435_c0_g1_i1.p1 TRINITY_DN435_c0_g1~~TRINITY_DN435_c0_g1_i1.p1  ORF type:complete len:657 (+),score=104.12 TRINITY_DN435_c0_g1_i1:100-2070(+)
MLYSDPVESAPEPPAPVQRHLTWRAILVGVLVGCLMCFSNMYFGLQTGWVTMGSLQTSLLGFAVFKVILRDQTFGPIENVLLQTAAVATATMPLAGGFVGIIPALKMMTDADGGSIVLTWWELIVFAGGLAFFGVFFAVPLREQTILREKLKFPSGYATAEMIKILHNVKKEDTQVDDDGEITDFMEESDVTRMERIMRSGEEVGLVRPNVEKDLGRQLWVLIITFSISGVYMILSFFLPVLKNIPVFTYMGLPYATEFYWMLTPSFSYVGQGMIMGTNTCLSMLIGAVIGWGVLAPTAQYVGWAPGKTSSFSDGAQGWLLWISLAVMMAESVSSLFVLIFKWIGHRIVIYRSKKDAYLDDEADPATPEQQVPTWWWATGLVFASALAVVCTWGIFRDRIPFYQPIIGVFLSLLVSVLAVRALGETDVNPVSGVGKLSQVVFALVAPNNIASNLVAGAIAEAGAQQAGDMMQDLKTGHLLKASPRAQFVGQVIGSFFSVFVAVGAFELYSNSYEIPGPEFQVPTAPVWLNMARFVNNGELPPNVVWFCIAFAILAAALPIVQEVFKNRKNYIISGMAFGIALYVTPNWTIPRFIGAMIQWFWKAKYPVSHDKYMLVTASGFVLGEGILSIVTALMKNPGGLQPWSCGGCAPGFCSC